MLLYSILRACIYLSIGVVYSPSPDDCVNTVTISCIKLNVDGISAKRTCKALHYILCLNHALVETIRLSSSYVLYFVHL